MQAADLDTQVGPHPGIERTQRLIEQQQAGRQGQGARQCNPLLLATRELGRVLRAGIRHANQLEKLVHAGIDLHARHAAADQPVTYVGRHRQVGKQRVGLEHDAEVALRRRQVGYFPISLEDAPRGLNVQPGDGTQQGGLAAAGRPQKTDELTLGNGERDVLEC